MKKLLGIILVGLLLLPFGAVGEDLGKGSRRVFDNAGLMTTAEITRVEELIAALRRQYKMDIVVLTSSEAPMDQSLAYADDFYDQNGFGSDREGSGFLFFIDMRNRVPTISTTGLMIRYITDDRLEALLDTASDYLGEGLFGDAAYMTLARLSAYLENGIPRDQYNADEYGNIDYYSPPPSLTGGEALIALAAGLLAALGLFFSVRHRYAMKGTAYKYDFRKNSAVSITNATDEYLRTHVSKVPKAPPPSSGGGGGGSRSSTHRSSSGRVHGGGSGRKF